MIRGDDWIAEALDITIVIIFLDNEFKSEERIAKQWDALGRII